MTNLTQTLLLSLLVAALSSMAHAQQPDPPARGNPTIDPMLVAAGFLENHPDLLYRSRGLEAYGEKNHPRAFQQFKRAAWYSDKPSQAIVGEMLWIGLGVEKDRALAYVWMDLAAERGYTSFSAKKNAYWEQLDPAERARAEDEGFAIRADYADAVAEQRLARALRRERNKATGSRLGSTISPMQIVVPGVGTIDSSQYYHPKYWDPVQYRQWQDSIWMDVRIGRVTTSDLQPVKPGDSPLPEEPDGGTHAAPADDTTSPDEAVPGGVPSIP